MHRMTGESALSVVSALDSHGVRFCIGGGWAVDALLGKQTREHSDLDTSQPAAELDQHNVSFSGLGTDLDLPWR
ncbi:nucleotidyltransferase domain-containing protein, partial [Streptomyces sp. NPDC056728]